MTADKRIPWLLETPAAVRFVSYEPALEKIDILADRISPTMRSENKIDWVICGGESGPGARPMHPDWARSIRDQCQAAGVPFFFKQWGEWVSVDQAHMVMRTGQSIRFADMDSRILFKTGKKKAGRLLDGREWNEMPKQKDK